MALCSLLTLRWDIWELFFRNLWNSLYLLTKVFFGFSTLKIDIHILKAKKSITSSDDEDLASTNFDEWVSTSLQEENVLYCSVHCLMGITHLAHLFILLFLNCMFMYVSRCIPFQVHDLNEHTRTYVIYVHWVHWTKDSLIVITFIVPFSIKKGVLSSVLIL